MVYKFMKLPKLLNLSVLRKPLQNSPRVAWIVLFVCMVATMAWWQYAKSESEQRAKQHFEQRINEIKSLIDERLGDYGHLLTGSQGLFSTLDEINGDQWHDYVISQNLKQKYPGVLALAFARHVKEEEKEKFIGEIRSGDIPDFMIKPGGVRPEYAPEIFRESVSENAPRVIGFDQFAEPARRSALQQARDTGMIAATGKLNLAHGPGQSAITGFILYAPVYRRGALPKSVYERREALVGFILCPITVEKFMKDIFGSGYSDVDLEIFDGSEISKESQFHDADFEKRIFGPGFHSKFSSRASLDVFGRNWNLLFSSLPTFEASVDSQKPRLVLEFGLLASLLLFFLTWSLARTRAQAVSLAAQMTSAFKESERKYSSLMEQASDAILVADRDGKYIDVNAKACELLGYTEEELLGLHVHDLLLPEEVAVNLTCLDELCIGETAIKERPLRRKDGSLVPVEISAKILGDGRLQEIIRDISERKKTEEGLQLAATVFETASEGIVIADRDNRIISVNPAFTRITGYTESEARGNDPKILRSGKHDQEFYRDMWHKLKSEGKWQGEIMNRQKSGVAYHEWLSINTVTDAKGNVVNFVAIFSDISKRKTAEEKIRHLAHHDALTDLPNRSLLRDRLDQAVKRARRDNLKFAVMFLDLDRFKSINDTLGHEVGDHVLQHAAKNLVGCVREGDTVARLGGDEFIVLLQGIQSRGNADAIAEKMQKEFAKPFTIGSHRLTLSASIGIAMYPEDGRDDESLLKHADIAMYHAKEVRNACRHLAEIEPA